MSAADPKPERRCTARVADHTDTVHCGRLALRADRCARCLHEEVHALLREIREHESAIGRCRERLTALCTEAG